MSGFLTGQPTGPYREGSKWKYFANPRFCVKQDRGLFIHGSRTTPPLLERHPYKKEADTFVSASFYQNHGFILQHAYSSQSFSSSSQFLSTSCCTCWIIHSLPGLNMWANRPWSFRYSSTGSLFLGW